MTPTVSSPRRLRAYTFSYPKSDWLDESMTFRTGTLLGLPYGAFFHARHRGVIWATHGSRVFLSHLPKLLVPLKKQRMTQVFDSNQCCYDLTHAALTTVCL